MTVIEIAASSTGAHRNQTFNQDIKIIPEGWALIPTDMEMENFPFGKVVAEEIDGVMTVVSWTPGTAPEPEPEPESSTDDITLLKAQITALSDQNAMLEECLVEMAQTVYA